MTRVSRVLVLSLACGLAVFAYDAGGQAPPAAQTTSPARAPASGPTPAASGPASGDAAPSRPRLPLQAPRIADYRIEVTLDPVTKQLTGTQRLTWLNTSTDPVPDLWFHLYLNAFKHSETTFMRESGGQLRDDEMPDDGWGWINIESMRLPDGTDLLGTLTFEAPDDGNQKDRTVARVRLPKPVAPDERLGVDITFKAQLPRVFARTGYAGDYYLAGQWFPKLGVYEPAGMRGRTTGGWNCHQFHGHSEFYADFGRYDVSITVPAGLIVGATGVRTARRVEPDGRVTYVYAQENVHDFAWTASPDFVEVRRTFSATKEVSDREYADAAKRLGRSVDELRLSDVEVIFLMQPAHLPQLERAVQSVMASIKYLGLAYGAYPHRTLTVVDPPSNGLGSGGMEYPTFITTLTIGLMQQWPFTGVRVIEDVTVHEFVHQYFQGMLASNEFEEAWLDEGLTTYVSMKVMDAAYGARESTMSVLGLRLGGFDQQRLFNGPDRRYDVIRQPSWAFGPAAYPFYTYSKTAMALSTIEGQIGRDTMARAMRTYAERWRFAHPSGDDLFATLNEVSGRDLSPLITQLFDKLGVLDYEVVDVESEPVPPPAGHLDGQKTVVAKAPPAEDGPYRTTIDLRRRGEVTIPVDIAVKFEGRPPERLSWDGVEPRRRLDLTRPTRLEWVWIDPDDRLTLEINRVNNARRPEPDGLAATWLAKRWTFWVQQILTSVGL